MRPYILAFFLLLATLTSQAQLIPYAVQIGTKAYQGDVLSAKFERQETISFQVAGLSNAHTKIVCVQLNDTLQPNQAEWGRIVGDTLDIQANTMLKNVAHSFTFKRKFDLTPRPTFYSFHLEVFTWSEQGIYTKFYQPFFVLSEPKPLPIQLVTFSGKAQEGQLYLNWTTAQELNTSHFEVEASAYGSHFQRIGRVAASGTTNQTHAYGLLTPFLTPQLYVRLRVVDNDGTATYSPVLAFHQIYLATTTYLVHHDDRYYGFILEEGDQPLTLMVYDLLGRLIATQPATNQELPVGGVVKLLTTKGKVSSQLVL